MIAGAAQAVETISADIDVDQLRDLVDLARKGNVDAWEALYRRIYPRLSAFAARRVGQDLAADAVSETMAKSIAAIDRFEWRGGGFDAWIFSILRNVITDIHRRQGRFAEDEPADEPSSDSGPLEHLLDTEEASEMRDAFMRLNDGDRELLELRVIAGLDAIQVGEVLGKNPGAVRTAQSRALIRLRTILEGGGQR